MKERVEEAGTSQGNGSQRPEEKKAKVERPTVERDTSSVDTPTETADAPKRRRRQRGGVRRKGTEGESPLRPTLIRANMEQRQKRKRPPAKTQKVSQVKVAATKIAERLSKAATAKIVSDAKARHKFVSSREKLMKPVRAFGDRVRFLPSIPATDARRIRNIGWNNALVEMAQQSRAFVRSRPTAW